MPFTGTGPNYLLENTPGIAGELVYNGVEFSTLFDSHVEWEAVPDDARRTTRGVEVVITAEGLCVRPKLELTMDANFQEIRRLLSTPGGALTYTGRGFGNFFVNQPGGGGVRDLAWGPKCEIISFEPMGAGISAWVKVRIRTLVSEYPLRQTSALNVVMQFSYSSTLTYDEEQYSSVSLKGVLEIPITRATASSRIIPVRIVDDFRQQWLDIQFDLTKFRVTKRSFDISADKRTCKWEFSAEELPPMTLPPGMTKARGTYDVQPLKMGGQGAGSKFLLLGNSWSCTLRCTYTLRKDFSRAQAALAFYHILLFRMRSAQRGSFPASVPRNNGQQADPITQFLQNTLGELPAFGQGGLASVAAQVQPGSRRAQALLSHFSFSEGLYLDSRSITFEAAFILFTTFRTLLAASGVWRWYADGQAVNGQGRDTWRASMGDIVGWRSWLADQLDAAAEVIVDMGGGEPVSTPPITNQNAQIGPGGA